MWTNSLLKQNAWNKLKPYYWTAFGSEIAVYLIAIAINYAVNIIPSTIMGFSAVSMRGDLEASLLILYLLSFVTAFIVYAFFTGVAETGKCRFYYEARNGKTDFGNLFWSFQGGRYMPTVKIMFWRYLEIFLWSLLLIVPGIVKNYEYFLVPYLIAENPNLSKERAFEISRRTMDGEKWKCFVLQFSFIGWFVLGAIACYVGEFFVLPYFDATMAEFYICMRAKMTAFGITTEEELTGYTQNYQNYDMQNNTFQTQNSVNPYDNSGSASFPKVNLDKQDIPSDTMPHVNLDKNDDDNNHNNSF